MDKTELNASSYSQSDWEKSAIEYQKLVDDYMYSGKEYTDAEKEMAARAMGRYHALLVKNGIESPERKLQSPDIPLSMAGCEDCSEISEHEL